MYIRELRRALRGIREGDLIEVEVSKGRYKGILMPKTEFSSPAILVLKLEDGYNVGISWEREMRIRRLRKGREIRFRPSKLVPKKKPGLPLISILGCGGTIASRVEYETGAVYPAFSPGDLVKAIPKLRDFANIRGEKIFDLCSEDMTPYHWKEIAKRVAMEIRRKSDGIVLMHGTDVMHYTSAMLSFMLQNLPVPVVLVGAQRSTDRGSSDNVMNLLCAAKVAGYSEIAEVIVCMHGTMDDDYCLVHHGVKCRKMHTERRDAFRSINVEPIAMVSYPSLDIKYLRKDFNKRSKQRKLNLDTRVNPRVGLIKIHPYIDPKFIESLANYYDGIVIEGTGLGHVPVSKVDRFTRPILGSLKKLIERGIAVAITSQTIYGRLNPFVYLNLRKLYQAGVIYCQDMLSEVAWVKLMWVLGRTRDPKRVGELMTQNLVGEITSVTRPLTFLI
jgi:glutamyl-tRNA(Gln) amidotransferase subunit D